MCDSCFVAPEKVHQKAGGIWAWVDLDLNPTMIVLLLKDLVRVAVTWTRQGFLAGNLTFGLFMPDIMALSILF